ncbi:MAG: MerR family transcriptional regulator [Rhizobacter sp.]
MNIAAFAQRCGLSAHTLRYYERVGLLGNVTRQANGHRSFGPRDVEWVEFLHRLRATGMGIQEMQRYAELRARGDSTLAERQAMLGQHADRLAATLRTQQAHLRAVRQKIAIYDGLIEEATAALT